MNLGKWGTPHFNIVMENLDVQWLCYMSYISKYTQLQHGHLLGGSSHLVSGLLTPIISGLTLLIPFITGVITHLLSGMSHHVDLNTL